jgi:phosphohistidine phosphatase
MQGGGIKIGIFARCLEKQLRVIGYKKNKLKIAREDDMALYLVQHGKSLAKEKDPLKGLSHEGAAEVKRIADVATNYGVHVSRIVHSGKQRALQTAEILAEKLSPTEGVHQIDGINPLDDAAAFGAGLPVVDNIMVVGHLPFLEKLVAYLVTGKSAPPVFRMQNGGIICLDYYPDTTHIVIRWALMPHVG